MDKKLKEIRSAIKLMIFVSLVLNAAIIIQGIRDILLEKYGIGLFCAISNTLCMILNIHSYRRVIKQEKKENEQKKEIIDTIQSFFPGKEVRIEEISFEEIKENKADGN